MQIRAAVSQAAFLSRGLAGCSEVWLARTALLATVGFFFIAVPFVTMPLAPISAFIPAYESALTISDLITAVLLFGRFKVSRSRAVLVLGCGYLFTAFTAFSHLLMFPGVFSSTGLLGARSQSAAWLYMFWHLGFPLFVIAYALLKDKTTPSRETTEAETLPRRGAGIAILVAVGAVLAFVWGLKAIVTASPDILPALVAGNNFTTTDFVVISTIWLASLSALGVLLLRRPYTVLDLWLMVVMCAWLCDIGLAAGINGRFDLGWYASRIYGLAAASLLLIVLLIETARHHSRVVQLSAELAVANKSLEQLSLHDELTDIANRRGFNAYLARQIATSRRHKRILALVLCDVDDFKAYNDYYGHQAGDECLKQIAAALRSSCRRPADMAARYGGEEFALVLPDTELAGASHIAEAAREAVAQLKIPHPNSPAGPYVSISGGVAVLLRNTELTAEQLITAADQALYRAKEGGRDRMVSVPSEPGYELV